MTILAITLLAALLLGLWLLRLSRQRRVRGGLPVGQVVYSDSQAWQAVARPLVSQRYGLIGKPDYLVTVARNQAPVPVEVKTGRRPVQPYPGHIMQLAAYCLLVEEQWQAAPAYGLIHYGEETTFRIDYTPALRAELLAVLDEMRAARTAGDVSRSHHEPARCQRCGVAHACEARL
jgi:CRISPR-associated exonuclease Cas4